ncbi:MAG: shikimate kinase [Actinomycetota bacterium]
MAAEESLSPVPVVDGAGNIALIGFMGSGKSTVGPMLAARLGMGFVELDEVISAGAGMSVADIFAAVGEEGFRDLESKALEDVLREGGKVISCGGGAVLRKGNVELLQERSRVFLLEISRRTALQRLREEHGRPLLEGSDLEERVDRLMRERAHAYAAAAHEVIEADDASPEEIAEEIAERWRR